jgi:hypothetical protein
MSILLFLSDMHEFAYSLFDSTCLHADLFVCVSIRYSNPGTATVSYWLRSMEHCNAEMLFFIRFVIVCL